MKTTLKRIITSDGLELVGLLYEPEIPTKKILVHVHGMAGNFYENKFLDAIAKTLTDNGVAFFAFNNRGSEAIKDLTKISNGKVSLVRIGDVYEKFEDCVFDIGAAIDAVSQQGFEIIHLSGHSLGGPKVAHYFSETNDSRIASIIFLSPADMLGLVRNNPKRFAEDIAEAQNMVKEGKGSDLMSRQVWDDYPITASTYLSLFADDSKAAIFNFYNSLASFDVLGKINKPVVVITGNKDDAMVFSVQESMDMLRKAVSKSPKVETVILGDADHGYNKYEQKLADAINSWIQKM